MSASNGEAFLDLAQERLAASGIDARDYGESRLRSDCPVCPGKGNDRLITRLDFNGNLWFNCNGRCEHADVAAALNLTPEDLRAPAETTTLVRRRLAEIALEPVEFLMPERAPRRGATMVGGDPGLGKSMFSALIAAETSRGIHGFPSAVAILNAEDPPSVVRARVQAAGGDLERIELLSKGDAEYEQVLTLPDDVSHIEDFVVETGAALVIIDPLMAFLADRTDANQDHSVRRALGNLALMAARRNVAVLVCAHLNKDEQKAVLYRVGGSIGLVGAARSLLLFARDPDDPEGERGDLRLLAHAKSNWSGLAPTLRYRQELVEVRDNGVVDTVMVLRPAGESDLLASELVGHVRGENKSSEAEKAILVALSEGPRLSSEVKAEVEDEVGCGLATVDRAAKQLRNADRLESGGSGPQTRWWIPSAGVYEQPPHEPPHVPLPDDEVVRIPHSKAKSEPPHHFGEGDEVVDEVVHEVVSEPSEDGCCDLDEIEDPDEWIAELARQQQDGEEPWSSST